MFCLPKTAWPPTSPPEIHLSIDQMRPLNFLADVAPLPVMPQLEPSPKVGS